MKSLRTSSIPDLRPAGRVLAGLLLLTLFSALLSLCLGSTFVSPALVLQALLIATAIALGTGCVLSLAGSV